MGMNTPFRVVLADPPWQHPQHGTRPPRAFKDNSAFDYRRGTIPTEELVEMRPLLDAVTDAETVLLLWVPNSMIPQGVEVLKGWGFQWRTTVPWVKYNAQSHAVNMTIGMWVFGASEQLFVGVRKKSKPPKDRLLGLLEHDRAGWIEAPRFPKVRKPESEYQVAESLRGPYLEMFATQRRDGWTSLGIEITGNDIRVDLAKLQGEEA